MVGDEEDELTKGVTDNKSLGASPVADGGSPAAGATDGVGGGSIGCRRNEQKNKEGNNFGHFNLFPLML